MITKKDVLVLKDVSSHMIQNIPERRSGKDRKSENDRRLKSRASK